MTDTEQIRISEEGSSSTQDKALCSMYVHVNVENSYVRYYGFRSEAVVDSFLGIHARHATFHTAAWRVFAQR